MNINYDAIVIGAGHAGIEACSALSRLNLKTLLLAVNLDTIGAMPCNPAIGGPGKSQLVKEVDALDGVMADASDHTYIQYRMLNSSRGQAVQSLRAQSDKALYSQWMRKYVESLPNVTLRQGVMKKIILAQNKVSGIELAFGETITTRAIVLCAGTFLDGLIWIGHETQPASRQGEFAVNGLSDYLKSLGLTMHRLKTGTPPRIDGRTIDFTNLPKVCGDPKIEFFSNLDNRPVLDQLPCYQTRTTAKTHEIILNNLDKSPMYAGLIDASGPRYCPSIEDKIVRFKDKDSHHLFLEPEGRSTYEIYLQGCSTSLPIDVQQEIIHSLPGLENSVMMRPAYAVEYDYLPAIQFKHTLESKDIEGFFAAGQILGTSGYEEASAQGIVAGINAGLYVLNKNPFILTRSSSYIGTLIDDLVTKEINEPYRIMTSRSEYRLLLRQDNADTRLTPIGRSFGLVSDRRWQLFVNKQEAFTLELKRLKDIKIQPVPYINEVLAKYCENISHPISLYELLKRPKIEYEVIEAISPQSDNVYPFAKEIAVEIKYSGYIERQKRQVEQVEKLEFHKLPVAINYHEILNLSKEARERLSLIRPETIGQASRISGVSPADISVLIVQLESTRKLAVKK